jgi:hypothetical protein
VKRLVAALALAITGCGSSSSYAVRTGPTAAPPTTGPIAVYATREPPGVEVGVIEVKGFAEDGAIDVLMPEFVRKARALGADSIVVDHIGLVVEEVDAVVDDGQVLCAPIGCARSAPRIARQDFAYVRVRGRAFRGQGAP